LLVGLFCVLWTTRETTAIRPESPFVVIKAGEPVREVAEEVIDEVERLAKTDHIALLDLCLENYRSQFSDYTCTFSKEERINGKMMPLQIVDVTFRQAPYSVAMKWRTHDEQGEALTMPRGDRALYIEGRWKNQMLIRPTDGFLQFLTGGQVLRDPTDRDVMKATLRPISAFGFERSLQNLLKVYRQAADSGDLTFSFSGAAKIGGRDVLVLQRELPAKKDYPAAATVIYIDRQYLVPVMVEGYDWDGQKFCTYMFKDIKFNLNLPEDRFAPAAVDMKAP
jgi:hypothetical protein